MHKNVQKGEGMMRNVGGPRQRPRGPLGNTTKRRTTNKGRGNSDQKLPKNVQDFKESIKKADKTINTVTKSLNSTEVGESLKRADASVNRARDVLQSISANKRGSTLSVLSQLEEGKEKNLSALQAIKKILGINE